MPFKWKKLARQSYLYFCMARVEALIRGYVPYFPDINAFYLCFKENGDINGSFAKIKDRSHDLSFFSGSQTRIINRMLEDIEIDICVGNLGDYVYLLDDDKDFFYYYKVKLKDLKQRSKIIKQLDNYRSGKVESSANQEFNKHLLLANLKDPSVLTKPLSKKKTKLFENKLLWEEQ